MISDHLCTIFQYPIYSLLVFDSKKNAIPVAWIITPRFAICEIHRWMRALYDRIHSKDPTWKLGGFIIDDPLADLNVIRLTFVKLYFFICLMFATIMLQEHYFICHAGMSFNVQF